MVRKADLYPLQQVLRVKEKRVEEAERQLAFRKQELEKAIAKLKEAEKERDKVKAHFQDKLRQLREELDRGTTAPKIRQMRDYMKSVQEKLLVEEKKVKDHQAQVETAEKNVAAAKKELDFRRKEVDKLEQHKRDWVKGVLKEFEMEEAKEQDELGNIVYTLHQRERQR